ncbi:MAG TPA: SDR family oxidoreductase [Chitinophagaceae bacterium]|nr:SDR family oxidoreductase [Chitinophagaceae bacterium]
MSEKKVVYITGGSKGIGKGVAQYLINEGYRVAVSSRKQENADDAVADISGDAEDKLALQSDVRKKEDEEAAIQRIIDKWGRLDVLVANAGLGVYKSIEELSHDDWNKMIDTNVTGVFNSVKASLNQIIDHDGYIMTVASLQGIYFNAKASGYNASKFAIVGFTQALMLDLRQKGVKVTTILPGSVSTHFNEHTPSEKDYWKIQPEDMGELVYDLLKMNPRTLPSKIEVRPSKPPIKK